MKERWTSLRQDAFSTEKVLSLIDTYQDQIEKKGAAYRDYNKWGNWYFPFFFWTTEEYSQYYIRQMREWTEGRLEWMDKAIQVRFLQILFYFVVYYIVIITIIIIITMSFILILFV